MRSNHASSTSSTDRFGCVIPALLTYASTFPCASTVAPIAAAISLRRVTSARKNFAEPSQPERAIASTVCFPPSSLTSRIATEAPSSAHFCAIPAPNPDPPPVTTTTLSLRRISRTFERAREHHCRAHPQNGSSQDERPAIVAVCTHQRPGDCGPDDLSHAE